MNQVQMLEEYLKSRAKHYQTMHNDTLALECETLSSVVSWRESIEECEVALLTMSHYWTEIYHKTGIHKAHDLVNFYTPLLELVQGVVEVNGMRQKVMVKN